MLSEMKLLVWGLAWFGVMKVGNPAFGQVPFNNQPREIIIPANDKTIPLTKDEENQVKKAIDNGVDYLKKTQLKTGSWIFGHKENAVGGVGAHNCPMGFAALGGLTLLECGVPAGDPGIQQAARLVRQYGQGSFRTYEISLAILFLDRLGVAGDVPLIRSLGLRLAAGQGNLGAWSYNCPVMTGPQEKKLLEALRQKKADDIPKKMTPPPTRVAGENADNSNTQFALLGLWVARKHDLPLEYTLAFAERRFRLSESLEGWNYDWRLGYVKGYGSMTCVGLLGLAVGRGSAEEPPQEEKKENPKAKDEGIQFGLKALSVYMTDPTDTRWGGFGASDQLGPRGALSYYYLWSVERVGVLCNLKTIGGKDWYRWGMEVILPAQRPDGSWLGRGSNGFPAIDTCFALLFLKRADLLPDLRETLQKRIIITDPGLEPKGPFDPKGIIDPKKSPGDKTDPKKKNPGDKLDLKNPLPKKLPGEKSDGKKDSTTQPEPAPDAPLMANLGEVKAKEDVKLPLRVRGPAPFKITAIRGADEQLRVEPPTQSREVHELTLTLRLEKSGDFQRTLYLLTDIPGRAEVPVRIHANATP